MEKILKISETVEKIIILIFFYKNYGYKCIELITAIAKHDIWNKKLITFDSLKWPNLEEIVSVKKFEDIAVSERILPYPKYVE